MPAFSEELFSLEKDKDRRDGKYAEVRCDLRRFGNIDAFNNKSREFVHHGFGEFGFEGMADVAAGGAEIEHDRVVVMQGMVDRIECLHEGIIMKFFRAYVEVTNICGLACSFCPPKSQPNTTMPLPFFREVLKQLRGRTEEIALHVMGDPMVLSNLDAYLDEAHTQGFRVMITTSGFYLDPDRRSMLLHPSIRQINVSLNSFNKNSAGRSFEEYLEPILALCDDKADKRSDMFINLRLWNLEGTERDEAFNARLFTRLEGHFDLESGHIVRHASGERQSIRMASKVLLHFDRYFEWPALSNPDAGDGYCHGLRSQIAVLSDGRVVPCCLDGEGVIDLGNLHETNLDRILSSKRALAIASGFEDGKAVEELCRKCTYKKRFDKE